MNDLPEELLINILCRLPFKSIRSCLRVNKNFLRLIKNPSFIHSYTKIKNRENQYLMFWKYRCFELRREDNNFELYKQFNFPVAQKYYHNHIPNCNGVLCLRGGSDLMLWNPTINKSVTLPKSNLFPNLSGYRSNIAFWFDSLSNDYKLIRIFEEEYVECYRSNDPSKPPMVEIFSLNNNRWKDISPIAPYLSIDDASPPVFNGKLNWIEYVPQDLFEHGEKKSIITFDVNAEVFGTIDLPYILRLRMDWDGSYLLSYKETSIAVCCFVYDDFNGYTNTFHAEVWVMKEYGNVDSWTSLWIYDESRHLPFGAILSGYFLERGLGLLNNGEVLWEVQGSTQPDVHAVCESSMIISTDPETGLPEKVAVFPSGYFSSDSVVTYFEESLVLLDHV